MYMYVFGSSYVSYCYSYLSGYYSYLSYCCSYFVPIHPETKAKINEILAIDSKLDLANEYQEALSNIEEALEKSNALRQSILKKAFEGELLSKQELEKCRLEADWEPAEKLLEKIKQEKKK